MGERGRVLTLSSYRRSFSKEIVELPGTFDEFLACFNLDDWPKTPYLPDVNPYPLVSQIKNDYPADTVARYLYDNAPMPHEIISRLEKRIDECKLQVQEHAKHIFTLESEKSEMDEQPGQLDVTSSPESQDISKKKTKIEMKFPTEAPQESRNKELENFSFPEFNLWKLTKLPNNLEPAHMWDSVLKVHIFKGVNTKVLKQLFFSEASLAILQDSFWWWFLHKFQPDQEEQDHFFDRISDSYVTLLWSIPSYIKDAFLQMYPDCLSQAIYITFCEAFPQSCHRFDDQFKDELMDLIFQWIRGFKPQKFAWKNWKCPSTEKPRKSIVEKDSFSEISSHMKPQPRRRTTSRSRSRSRSSSRSRIKTLRFQVTTEEQMQEPAQETKESHYIGDGPDFQHSLFNLGGQSPLVSYYLQMHGIPNTLANSRGYRINHSEICKVPPLSPTYVDVIQKCKKTSKKLLDHFADFGHKCDAELVVLQEKREKTDRKFRRMLETITTKPTEKRVKIERFLLQRANAKIHHHGSCGSESGAKDV
ncbi:protein FAM227B isoform X2 [Crotalus tigris]|uniref:protein FAM227B isoform X2 n=1 Tax=Crotalus tigris TaxID=88082 RepID=UPI00192F9AEC|nr:protein FAM227B isoform X2 [Crotalus tigris]